MSDPSLAAPMEFTLRHREAVPAGVRRLALEQIDLALAELTDDGLDRHKAVHQVRKRCKKLRGLLRLVRPLLGATYDAENARFRDAARLLSDVRDATALLEAYDDLTATEAGSADRRAFGPIRAALTHRRRHIAETFDLEARVAQFADALHAARAAVATWPLDADGFDALGGGLAKTYRRGRQAMARAYAHPDEERFHEWRKRVKYHWYHTTLLGGIWPTAMAARADALDRLSDLLGSEHDLAVFRHTLLGEPARFGRVRSLDAFLSLLDARRAELQAEARPLGQRLFAEPPRALTRRFGAYWHT